MLVILFYFVFNLFFVNLFFLAFVRVGHRLGKFSTHVIKKTTKLLAEFYRPKLSKGLWNSLTRRSSVAFFDLILPRLPFFAGKKNKYLQGTGISFLPLGVHVSSFNMIAVNLSLLKSVDN